MNAPLPGPLNDNPQLDRWVAFPVPGYRYSVPPGVRVPVGSCGLRTCPVWLLVPFP